MSIFWAICRDFPFKNNISSFFQYKFSSLNKIGKIGFKKSEIYDLYR